MAGDPIGASGGPVGPPVAPAEVTVDEPAPGLRIAQPRRGFRYGAEAFWLAGFALEALAAAGVSPHGARALDLGAGSGVIGALLAARGLRVEGVELRDEWAALWPVTLASPALGGRLVLRRGDLRGVEGPVDLVVSNPPFFARGGGPEAAGAWRAAARTESTATLAQVVASGARAVADGGVVCLVVPADRAGEVRAAAAGARVAVCREVRVGARRSLLALRRGAPDAPAQACAEHDPAPLRWYALARGEASLSAP